MTQTSGRSSGSSSSGRATSSRRRPTAARGCAPCMRRHRTSSFLDVSMPDLDGWQTLERIRDLSDVPVAMLTARAAELEKVRGLKAGAYESNRLDVLAAYSLLVQRGHLLPRVPAGNRGDPSGIVRPLADDRPIVRVGDDALPAPELDAQDVAADFLLEGRVELLAPCARDRPGEVGAAQNRGNTACDLGRARGDLAARPSSSDRTTQKIATHATANVSAPKTARRRMSRGGRLKGSGVSVTPRYRRPETPA
jgi:CheY-like chemotaxis protein